VLHTQTIASYKMSNLQLTWFCIRRLSLLLLNVIPASSAIACVHSTCTSTWLQCTAIAPHSTSHTCRIPTKRDVSGVAHKPCQIPAERDVSKGAHKPCQIPPERDVSKGAHQPCQIPTERDVSKGAHQPYQLPAKRYVGCMLGIADDWSHLIARHKRYHPERPHENDEDKK
jgi:hypothetical protein